MEDCLVVGEEGITPDEESSKRGKRERRWVFLETKSGTVGLARLGGSASGKGAAREKQAARKSTEVLENCEASEFIEDFPPPGQERFSVPSCRR